MPRTIIYGQAGEGSVDPSPDRLEYESDREVSGELPERGAEEQVAPEGRSSVAPEDQALLDRARAVERVAPLFDKVKATGYLPSIFRAGTEPQEPSIGDVLRQQYVKLGGTPTFDLDTFARLATIVATLEGQVVLLGGIAADTDPDDASFQQGFDKGFSEGFATAQAQSA